jgi:hypothetical protein
MDREKAAEIFVRHIYDTSISGAMHQVDEMIDDPIGYKKGKWEMASHFFADLTPFEQEVLKFIIKESLVISLHKFLSSLDGVTGFYESNNCTMQYSVYLDLFEDVENAIIGNAFESIKISPTERGEDLHDIFMGLHDEADSIEEL